jgi:uncharacterized membrane protein (DUF373 family)
VNPRGAGRRNGRVLAGLELVEDLIYAVIAIFLIGSGFLLLIGAGIGISKSFDVNNIHALVVNLLDETLLVFVVVELLHTVRITLRDHSLAAEPFLIVGLIAGVRRILILTASSDTLHSGPDFVVYWVQLLLLIVLVVAMVVALYIWHRMPSGTDPGHR